MSYIAFPWEQIGILLRRLSLAGAVGNVAAWVLFTVIGGSPLILWGLLAGRKKNSRADLFLPVLSLTMFAGLWFLTNPSYLEAYIFSAGVEGMGKCIFALSIDSVLLSWLLLRFLGSCGRMERKNLLRSLEFLLGLYVALSVVGILFQGGAELLAEWKSMGVTTSGTDPEWMRSQSFGGLEWMPEQSFDRLGWMPGQNFGGMGGRSMGLSRCLLVLQTICRYLPELLELVLCGAAISFLHSCEQNSFNEKSLKQVQRLKNLSACFLGVILGANVCVNLLQLVLAGYIYSSHYTLVFPISHIIVMLGVLILSRFWLEGKELKDDNKLFI